MQTFETIAPYTIEEAYEVAEAIAHGDMDELKDELGDFGQSRGAYDARVSSCRICRQWAGVAAGADAEPSN